MKTSIKDFIDTYCIEVGEDEDSEYVEFMMEDYKRIVWDDKQYYIPENHILWGEEEKSKHRFLTECFIVE